MSSAQDSHGGPTEPAEALSRLDGLLTERTQDLRQELARHQAIPPDVLYHYTTAQGLIGITEAGRVWATDARYMNDSSEMVYTHELFRQRLTALGARDSRPEASLILEKFEAHSTFSASTLLCSLLASARTEIC